MVNGKGHVEVRLVGVHPSTGQVGSRTVFWFHVQYLKLIDRCWQHLMGVVDLFPDQHSERPAVSFTLPEGVANLDLMSPHAFSEEVVGLLDGERSTP